MVLGRERSAKKRTTKDIKLQLIFIQSNFEELYIPFQQFFQQDMGSINAIENQKLFLEILVFTSKKKSYLDTIDVTRHYKHNSLLYNYFHLAINFHEI